MLLAVTLTSNAYAHVVVKPAEVVTAGFQTFTAGVPNEKPIAVTGLKVIMPEGLNYVSPTQKTGWNISIEKVGEGEDAKVKSISWEGGTISSGFRDDFTFSAQVPEKATELQWKAYQTYADGTVVAWDQAEEKEGDEKSGPYSVTKVVAQTEADSIVSEANEASSSAKAKADTTFYIAIAGLLVAVGAIYLVTKKK